MKALYEKKFAIHTKDGTKFDLDPKIDGETAIGMLKPGQRLITVFESVNSTRRPNLLSERAIQVAGTLRLIDPSGNVVRISGKDHFSTEDARGKEFALGYLAKKPGAAILKEAHSLTEDWDAGLEDLTFEDELDQYDVPTSDYEFDAAELEGEVEGDADFSKYPDIFDDEETEYDQFYDIDDPTDEGWFDEPSSDDPYDYLNESQIREAAAVVQCPNGTQQMNLRAARDYLLKNPGVAGIVGLTESKLQEALGAGLLKVVAKAPGGFNNQKVLFEPFSANDDDKFKQALAYIRDNPNRGAIIAESKPLSFEDIYRLAEAKPAPKDPRYKANQEAAKKRRKHNTGQSDEDETSKPPRKKKVSESFEDIYKLNEGGPRRNIDYDGIAHQFCLIKNPVARQEACDKLFDLIKEKNTEAAAKEAEKTAKDMMKTAQAAAKVV